jgi:copper chaperone CopZ
LVIIIRLDYGIILKIYDQQKIRTVIMASQKITLNVDGMSCGHCSGMVQRTLEGIKGISNVVVDLNGKKADFEVSEATLVEKAIKEINEAGYKASKP